MNLCVFSFYKFIGKLTAFFAVSGLQLAQSNSGQFHYHRVVLFPQFRSKVGNILIKVEALWINLNIDGVSITSKSRTHQLHHTLKILVY